MKTGSTKAWKACKVCPSSLHIWYTPEGAARHISVNRKLGGITREQELSGNCVIKHRKHLHLSCKTFMSAVKLMSSLTAELPLHWHISHEGCLVYWFLPSVALFRSVCLYCFYRDIFGFWDFHLVGWLSWVWVFFFSFSIKGTGMKLLYIHCIFFAVLQEFKI